MTNYAMLVRDARKAGYYRTDTTPLKMTPAVFGKMLISAWAARYGRSDFPRRDLVIATLLRAANTAPEDIKAVMHVEPRITGDVIAEYGEYLAAAQVDGLVKRYNPDYVRVAVEIDESTGEAILAGILRNRESHRGWLDELVSALNARAGEGAIDASGEVSRLAAV